MSTSTSTPPAASSSRSSPSSLGSDDSLADLSFDYGYDSDGKLIRVSKGSSKSPNSSPPTPPQTQELPPTISSSSTIASASSRRSSLTLTRSESMPGSDSLAVPTARPLIRTTSGPVSIATPAQSTRNPIITPLSGGLQGTGRKLGGAQRIRKEEAERQRREIEDRIRREADEVEREKERERTRRALEEKENVEMRHSPPQANSRPIASLPSRQNYYGFPRVARPLVSSKKFPSISRINEVETDEGELDDAEYNAYGQQNYYQKPSPPEKTSESYDQLSYLPSSRSLPMSHSVSRSNSSASIVSKARRVTVEERMRQEQEIADEEAMSKFLLLLSIFELFLTREKYLYSFRARVGTRIYRCDR
ncbi:hypothetical protein DFH11DRAFT_210425 [Phellopilus nigrolimitatus]|nr:hypothetical protein DFH11DRAFT_210425 [Phellopilus nigrolimitatus]